MKSLVVLAIPFGLSACVANQHSANLHCAGTAGCVSSFADTGYGPIQAQAVASVAPGPLRPQD